VARVRHVGHVGEGVLLLGALLKQYFQRLAVEREAAQVPVVAECAGQPALAPHGGPALVGGLQVDGDPVGVCEFHRPPHLSRGRADAPNPEAGAEGAACRVQAVESGDVEADCVADRWGCLRRALCPGVAGSEDRQQERYRGSDDPHKSPTMPSLVRQVLILSLQRYIACHADLDALLAGMGAVATEKWRQSAILPQGIEVGDDGSGSRCARPFPSQVKPKLML
jgi:hypothetical protein